MCKGSFSVMNSSFSIRIHKTFYFRTILKKGNNMTHPDLCPIFSQKKFTSEAISCEICKIVVWNFKSTDTDRTKTILKAAKKATVFQMYSPRYEDQIVSQ